MTRLGRPWTVRKQLNLTLAAVAVPLVILAAAMIAFVLSRERRAAEETVLQVARGVALTIDRELASAESALRVLATSAYLRSGDWAAFHNQATAARTSQDAWILLFDPTAQQLVNTRFPRGTPLARRANPDRVTEVLTTRQASLSDVYVGVLTQQPIVTVDVPVMVDGEPRYVLTQAYFLDHFEQLLRRSPSPDGWILAVMDREGVTVARSLGTFAGSPASEDILTRARASREGGLVRRTREGVVAYQAFTRSERSGWLVTVAVPTSALNAPAARALLVTGLGALLAVGLATVLAASTSRRLTRPLRALAEDAAALESGAPLPPRPPAAVHEIDRVGRALEQAAAVIRSREARLRILHEIDRALLAARSPMDIASGALGRLRQLIGVPRAVLAVLHEPEGEAEWLAVDVEGSTTLGPGVRFPLAMLGDPDTLRRGEVQRMEVAGWPHVPEARRLAAEGIGHYVVIPLIAGGRLIGTVNFGADQAGAIADEAIDIAHEVAAQLAVVLEQSRLREELARYARELEDRVDERTRTLTEINEQLEAFAYSVSHDLRAPLRALEGFAQALMKHYAAVLDARGQDYARRIAAAAARMDRLIRDLLAYSHVTRADMTLGPVDVDQTMAEVLRQLDGDVVASRADILVAPGLPRVRANEALLVQALRNVVANALTFVPPGVRPVVRISAELDHHTVRLSVEDNGIGIPAEHHERIFNVFERLHGVEAYPGTGIGLAIARKAVERMRGRIGVEPGPAGGSRFWIELPAANRGA